MENLIKKLEQRIDETPTGKERNFLTELNIYLQSLKKVSENYNELDSEIAKCYEENSESDLVEIGEITATHFGWL